MIASTSVIASLLNILLYISWIQILLQFGGEWDKVKDR